MPKEISLDVRLKTPVITMVPLILREQMEKMARQSKVSLSEIGRRALTEYVGRYACPRAQARKKAGDQKRHA